MGHPAGSLEGVKSSRVDAYDSAPKTWTKISRINLVLALAVSARWVIGPDRTAR